ncbi:MAG: hypothetical protein ACKOPS_12240 [Cyanobium sp.]
MQLLLPLGLIPFGSGAHGELAAANDLDLLVVEPEITSQARYNERCQIPGSVEYAAHRI